MMRKVTFLLVFLCSLNLAFGQDRVITGKVIEDSGTGLPGTTVQLKGTSKGTVTDINGAYTISVPSSGGILVFSYVGYLAEEITIGESNTIDVSLAQDVQSLDQVVVVGYGVQKKSLVTGAISKIDSKDIASSQVARVDQALQGKTSGVYMAQTSGSPGSAMSVKIRGNGSNGKNDPLYIVDGVKTSGIDFLSPNDIESIEILKDAASSAIYGSEGGNGVVIITTKKAKEGTSEINYNYYHGVQKVSNYIKMMDAKQYLTTQLEALMRESKDTIGDGYKNMVRYYFLKDSAGANTNWMDQIISNAPVDEHNISFSSASEKNKLYLSASYFTQDGIIGGSKNNFTRYTFHFSGDSKVKEWLNVGSNVTYAKSEKNNLNESNEFGGIVTNAMFFDPTVPVYYKDTSELPLAVKYVPNDPKASENFNALVKNDQGQYYHLSDYTLELTSNPLAQIYNTHNTTTMDKVLADVHGDILFGKSLKFTSKLALDYSLGYDNIFTPKYYYSSENFAINDTSGVKLQNTFSKQYKYSFENYASYNNIFGDHSIELLAGMSYEKFVPNYLDVTSYNVPQGNLNYAYLYNTLNNDPKNIPIISGGLGVVQNNVANKDNPQQIITNYTELQNSYFGRIVYNYKEKYMLQGNIRRDGSNLLGPDNLYGIFPSFSLGWNISKEDFFADNISFINSMKIRFSWGQNGNKQVLTPFQYTSNMTNGYNTNIRYNYPNASHNLSSAIVPETPGNPTLKWETSQQSDLGVEMMMLKNKLVIGVDYFDKRTIDQLAIDAKVPLYLGFNSNPFTNNGEVQNKGVEFDITYRESESEFKYSVSINASYLKNKVLSYGSEGTFKEGAKIGPNSYVTRYEAGYPVYYFKGYQALGIFQDTLEIQSYLNASGAPLQKKAIPGDVKYLDANNDGKIDGSDALNYLGKPMPDWTYGLNLTCQYKGFDASAFFQGVKGNQIFFAALSARLMFNKPEYYFTERWNGPGTSNKYPRSSTGVATARGMTSANFNYSNLNVFDGDYLRLKNVTIGYTIPKDLTSKIGIGKLRFYFTATNLLTFTKYPGSDPEIGQVMSTNPSYFGIDRGLYPASKTYTGGLNVTF